MAKLVHIAAAAPGLSALLLTSAPAFNVVTLPTWPGLRTLLTHQSHAALSVSPRKPSRLFANGSLVNLFSPKAALF